VEQTLEGEAWTTHTETTLPRPSWAHFGFGGVFVPGPLQDGCKEFHASAIAARVNGPGDRTQIVLVELAPLGGEIPRPLRVVCQAFGGRSAKQWETKALIDVVAVDYRPLQSTGFQPDTKGNKCLDLVNRNLTVLVRIALI
jgi:hypothetical protein